MISALPSALNGSASSGFSALADADLMAAHSIGAAGRE
jgi:hypothetical protein